MFSRKPAGQIKSSNKDIAQSGLQKFNLKFNKYGDEKLNWSKFRKLSLGKTAEEMKIKAGTKPRWDPPAKKDLQTWNLVDESKAKATKDSHLTSPDK